MSKKKKKLKLNNIPPLEENTPLLELFVFKENSFEESKISDLSSLPGIIESSKFVWLNVDCFNTATITEVSKIFNFH